MTKADRTRQIKREISQHKSHLIKLQGAMEREGLAREARTFGNIIARLEDFQNS